jgi:hypothetical protein
MDGRRRGRRRRQDRSMPPRSLSSLSSLLAMSSPPSLHPSLFRFVDGACSFALRAHGLCRRCENAVGGDGVDCSRVRQARGSRGRPSDAPGRLDGSHKRKRLARTASGRRIKQERANRGRELGRPSTYELAHLTHRRGPAQRMRPRAWQGGRRWSPRSFRPAAAADRMLYVLSQHLSPRPRWGRQPNGRVRPVYRPRARSQTD